METIYQKLTEILLSTGIAKKEIHLQAAFSSDLGMDSLDRAELFTLCEDAFGIDIPDSAIYHFTRLKDVVAYIHFRLNPGQMPVPNNHKKIFFNIAKFLWIKSLKKNTGMYDSCWEYK